MKITVILLAITVPWAVAFPSGFLDGVPFLGDIFGGGGGYKTNGKDAHAKHNSQVCLNNSFYRIYK